MIQLPPSTTLFPYTTLFRSRAAKLLRGLLRFVRVTDQEVTRVNLNDAVRGAMDLVSYRFVLDEITVDRKSTRLNSSHSQISYAVFCLKKKNYVELVSQYMST